MREVRSRIGYVFGGDRGLYERLSGLDNLRYFSELYGVPPREQKARIGALLELVGLTGREGERVEGYSRGMRQRLHIARGLLHDPDVFFLDEPSIGIDPVGARELRATIAALREQGKTVLLTTHYMFEADELCDRIAVIRSGEIVAEGTPGRAQGPGQRRPRPRGRDVRRPRRTVASGCGPSAGVRSVAVEERGQLQVLVVACEPGAEVTQAVLARLDDTRVGRVSHRDPTLEDAYVELVTRTGDDPAPAAGRLLLAAAQDPAVLAVRGLPRGRLPADVRHRRAAGLPGRRRPGGDACTPASAPPRWASGRPRP